MIDRLRSEQGLGMVTALAVTFVIFALSATWYALAVHTNEQAAFGTNRTQALAVAEAGVREAMFEVLDSQGTYTGLGAASGVCNTENVTSQGQQLGTYWTRVTQIGAARDRTFLIQSWGWAPEPGAAFTTPKYIEQRVKLVPSDFFTFGGFASDGQKDPNKADNKLKLEKVDKLRIYGDAYFGQGAQLKDFRVYQNTGGYAGEGNLYGQGTLWIDNKKGVYIQGDTVVRYKLYDEGKNTEFNGDIYILENTGAIPDAEKPFKDWVNDAYFKDATVNGSIFLPGGATFESGSKVNGGAPVSAGLPAATLPPQYDLPDYNPAGMGVTYDLTFNSVGAFDAWFKNTTNRQNLGLVGATHSMTIHIVDPSNHLDLDFKDNTRLRGDLSIYAEVKEVKVKNGGDLKPDYANPPYQLSIVHYSNPAVEDKGQVKIEGHSQFTDQLRVFIYSDGTVEMKDKTVIYGAIYTKSIESKGGPNRLYYRTIEPPLGLDTTNVEDVYAIQPQVWRELDPQVTKNFVTAATRYCTLP